jgi:hypothetical protein
MLDLWYKSAIFYSLSVGSFMDANSEAPLRFTLDGCGYRWLRLQEHAS